MTYRFIDKSDIAPFLEPPELTGQLEPDRQLAAQCASRVRTVLLGNGLPEAPLVDLEARLLRHRFRVRDARLYPDQGGPQALLVPLQDDAFHVPVDPTPARGWAGVSARLRSALARHRRRFLAAHECAHSLFFERAAGQRPERQLPVRATEEEFCDEFARWLLVPPEAARRGPATARAVFALQRRYDVSVQLAARALCEARGDRPWAMIAVKDPPSGGGAWRIQWKSVACPPELLGLPGMGEEPVRRIEHLVPSAADSIFDPVRRQLVAVG